MSPRKSGLFLGTVLAVYFAAEAVIAARFPIFYDEGLFVSEAQLLSDRPTHANALLAVADNHGPLQRWVIAALIHVGVPGLTAGRILSIVAGAVTIVSVFALARRISSEAACFAALAAALTPALLVHSAIAIADPLAVALLSATAWLALRHAEAPSLRRGLAVGLALGAALLTKKTGLLGVAFIPLSALALIRGRATAVKRAWAGGSAIALAVCAAAWLVLRTAPEAYRSSEAEVANINYRGFADVLGDFPAQIGPGLRDFGGDLVTYATPTLLLLAVVGLVVVASRRTDLAVLIALWAIAPFVVSVVSARLPYPRYVLASYPALVILAGVGLATMRSYAGRGSLLAYAAGVACAAALIPAIVFDAGTLGSPSSKRYPGLDDWQYSSGWPAGTAWPRLARSLRRGAAARNLDKVVVAFGGRDVGPIGLAAQLGHPVLVEGAINATHFTARGGGRSYTFVPLAAAPDAPFLVGQDVDINPPPPAVTRRYRPRLLTRRPHDGAIAALYELRRSQP